MQIGEHKIDFKHYKLLYEADGGHQVRAVPKLTKEHVDPDNLRKMNVKLAVQVIALDSSSNTRYGDVTGPNHFKAPCEQLKLHFSLVKVTFGA